MTIKLEQLDTCREMAYSFATKWDTVEKTKIHMVDTILLPEEYTTESLNNAERFAPFGEANREPLFLIPKATITAIEKVGKTGNGHMKIHAIHEGIKITSLFR